MKKIKRKYGQCYLKSEVIPTRKCAKVLIKSTREAGTGTGEETKIPNSKKENKGKKLMKNK
jgi:hypothetical protein